MTHDPTPSPARRQTGPAVRKRVLVVNAFFDEYRRTGGSPHRVPRAMGPVFLAGAFSNLCDVRIHSEQYSGALRDAALLGWPDMLVLTGLTTSFDRMLHLTAYARTLNPKVVVVAGGPPVRALPRRSRRFFDYACDGDIEQLQAIAREVFGPAYVATEMVPRFDLFDCGGITGYVESSRYCNFHCSFCALTAEGRKYRTYDLDYVRHQVEAVGNKHVVFIDNNFYGNNRRYFLDRVEMLGQFHRAGRIRGWSALVTEDFFHKPENLALCAESGCFALFSGVESFDSEILSSYNKRQNTLLPQVDIIRRCLEAGIYFSYGIMLDPNTRRLADLRREIEFILDTPEISFPSFFTLPIPLLGTPYFKECLEGELFLPSIRLHDLDGVTVCTRPLDPIEEVVRFARDLPNLRGYRLRAMGHAASFLRRYRKRLKPFQLVAAMVSVALICTESFASSPGRPSPRQRRRTYLGTTEHLNPLYEPMIGVASRYQDHFRPTMVTDAGGNLSDDIAEDYTAIGVGPPDSSPTAPV